MQPGTPHFVYGLEHTITYGGHFYASSLMQATTESLVEEQQHLWKEFDWNNIPGDERMA